MKFQVYIDGTPIQELNNATKGEQMIIQDDLAMLVKSGIKASIHLASDRSPYNDLSNRNIRVERIE